MYVFRLSWRRRIKLLRDLAVAIAQLHDACLEPGARDRDRTPRPACTRFPRMCTHDVRVHNIMLDSNQQSVVLIDLANGSIDGLCNYVDKPSNNILV